MPNSCAAYGCNNRFGPESQQNRITFHQLPPPGEARRKLWIANSRRIDPLTRKPWNPSFKYIYFCSDHFTPADYEICGKTMGRRLKANAVPTVFTFPTVVPPDPEENTELSEGSSIPGTHEKSRNARPGKPRNRKVVMLPKKIKLLQDAGESDVESVTIISFQHLQYNEQLQPIFEEAMLDLQYPEEVEEHYGDYDDNDYDVEDEYTGFDDSPPVKQQKTEQKEDDNISEKHLEDDENMDCSNDMSNRPPENERERSINDDESNNYNVDQDLDISDTIVNRHDGNPGSEKSDTVGLKKDISLLEMNPSSSAGKESEKVVEQQTKTSDTVPVKQVLNKVAEYIPKRKVPVVMKEISGIKDIEDLRIKSFKIAEDNIMLKRQVIYLERKLKEIVSELYE